MEFKTRYITADEFKQYFGIDLQIELPNGDNESGKVAAYIARIENRLEAWINANYFYNVTQFWETLNNNQKEQYKYALLEQAYYVLRMGDISVDSGYDKERGVVAGRSTINELSVASNSMLHLENGGFLNTRIVKRGGYYQGGISTSQVVSGGGVGQKGEPGKDGLTPFIGDNGNWWIGGLDTGVVVAGQQGIPGINGTNGIGFGATYTNGQIFFEQQDGDGEKIKNFIILFNKYSGVGQGTLEFDEAYTNKLVEITGGVGKILSIHFWGLGSNDAYFYLNGELIDSVSVYDRIELTLNSANCKLVEIL